MGEGNRQMRKLVMLLSMLIMGFLSGYVCQGCNKLKTHWQAIENYKSYFANPDRWRGRAAPPYPEISLSILVSAGELKHVDLVFPNVPYERAPTKYWMDYCRTNTGIVFAFGNPSYVDLMPKGVQLLHLNLWFKESSMNDVKHLIGDIDSK